MVISSSYHDDAGPLAHVGAGDEFGASTAVAGPTLLVGAPNNDAQGADAGQVLSFHWEGFPPDVEGVSAHRWYRDTVLLPSARQAGEWFGWAVAVEGEVALVGAPGPTSADDRVEAEPREVIGRVVVFARAEGRWLETQVLNAPTPAQGDQFGRALAVEGDVGVVGARGAAYALRRTGVQWAVEATLGMSQDRLFGCAVAARGDRAAVSGESVGGSRSVRVFARSGTSWAEEPSIVVPAPMGSPTSFSSSVAVGSNFVAVATPRGEGDLFTLSGGAWSKQVVSSGAAVAVSGDDVAFASLLGARVLRRTAGVWSEIGNQGHGPSTDLFGRSGSRWQRPHIFPERRELARTPDVDADGHSTGRRFGAAIALGADRALIGAPGTSIALHDDTAFVGAPGDDTLSVDSGAAYLFSVADTCVDDETALDLTGQHVACAPYRCLLGACAVRCENAGECTPGHRCSPSGECRVGLDAIDESGGCEASAPRAGERERWSWAAAAALIGLGVARRRHSPR